MSLGGPQADPRVTFAERDGAFVALTAAGDAVRLNALQVEALRRSDGRTAVAEIAERCSETFQQEVPAAAIERFMARAAALGLLSLRSGGLVDVELAARRCRRVRRSLAALGLPPRGAEGERRRRADEVLEHLGRQRPQAALDAAYALEEAGPAVPWVGALVREVERLGEPAALEDSHSLFVALPLVDPSSVLRWLDRRLGWLFGPLGAVLWTVSVAGALWLVVADGLPAWSGPLHPTALLTLYLAWCVSVPLHELSHAWTCHHFGAPVRRMGIGLMLGVIVFAWADVTSSYLIREKWKRLLVVLAGLLGSLWFMAACTWVAFALAPESPVRQGVVIYLVTGAIGNVGFNLAPFIRLDGYYFLAELLDTPNLRRRAFDLAGRVGARVLLGPSVEVPALAPGRLWGLLGFAAFSVASAAAVILYGTWIAYRCLFWTWRGYGLAAIAGGLLLVLGPAAVRRARGVARLLWHQRRDLVQPRRLARNLGAAVVPVAAVMLIPLPESTMATYEVVPTARAEVRAAVPGLVREVLVRRGDRVQAGQPLAHLVNHELERRRAEAHADLLRTRALRERCENGPRPAERKRARETARARAAEAGRLLGRSARRASLGHMGLLPASEVDASWTAAAVGKGHRHEAEATLRLVEEGCREEELRSRRAVERRAAAILAATEEDLAALVLRSPVAGTLVDPIVEESVGRYLEAGDSLATVLGGGLVAELEPDWIAWRVPPGEVEAKLLLASGRVVRTTVAQVLPQSGSGGALRLRSDVLDGSPLTVGATGRARIYGPPVPLFVEYVWHPLERWMLRDLWLVV